MDKTSDCAMNTAELIEKARQRLHAMPELACEEVKTKAFIIDFLRAHTSMEVHDMGRWLFAAHFEQAGETVAFRADFDAVPTESGGAAHRCGHDGHTAALLGLALLLEGKKVGRNVILLFQHAEEVGFGAPECCRLFELEHIDKMYGCHNIPGEQMGRVLLRKGTFACASCGLEIKFIGKPTHAAYPENGVNPTPAVSRLALALPQMAEEIEKRGGAMTIATIVGMYTGEKAFGVAAAQGALYATLRSENGACLEELLNSAKTEAQKLADEYGLQLSIGLYDKFPATVNTDNMVADWIISILKCHSAGRRISAITANTLQQCSLESAAARIPVHCILRAMCTPRGLRQRRRRSCLRSSVQVSTIPPKIIYFYKHFTNVLSCRIITEQFERGFSEVGYRATLAV